LGDAGLAPGCVTFGAGALSSCLGDGGQDGERVADGRDVVGADVVGSLPGGEYLGG
jgi:hypothetical protein